MIYVHLSHHFIVHHVCNKNKVNAAECDILTLEFLEILNQNIYRDCMIV